MNRLPFNQRIMLLIGLLVALVIGLIVTGQLAIQNSLAPQVITANVRATPVARNVTPIAPYGPIDPAIISALQSTPGNKPFAVLPGVQPVGVYLPGIAPRAELPTITPTVTLPPLILSPTPSNTPVASPTPTIPPITPTPKVAFTAWPTPTHYPTDIYGNDLGIIELDGLAWTPNPKVIGNNCAPRGLPVDGVLTQRFHVYHSGIDLGVPLGTPVLATHSGQVIFAGWSEIGYGWLVIIQNGQFISYYAHNSALNVERYQYVQVGQIISYSGSTGNSSGPHVHYETRIDSVAVDPLTFDLRGLPTC